MGFWEGLRLLGRDLREEGSWMVSELRDMGGEVSELFGEWSPRQNEWIGIAAVVLVFGIASILLGPSWFEAFRTVVLLAIYGLTGLIVWKTTRQTRRMLKEHQDFMDRARVRSDQIECLIGEIEHGVARSRPDFRNWRV